MSFCPRPMPSSGHIASKFCSTRPSHIRHRNLRSALTWLRLNIFCTIFIGNFQCVVAERTANVHVRPKVPELCALTVQRLHDVTGSPENGSTFEFRGLLAMGRVNINWLLAHKRKSFSFSLVSYFRRRVNEHCAWWRWSVCILLWVIQFIGRTLALELVPRDR